MKKYFVPLTIVTLVLGSCKKNENPPPTLPTPDDAKTILLKEVVAQSLPSPYFHFKYDSERYVKQIDFASGFFIYNVEYENKRVKKMTNIQNNNFTIYTYANDQVAEINEFSGSNGDKVFSYKFAYNSSHQLKELFWFEFFTNPNGHLYKKAVFSYLADGNLSDLEHYYDISGTQLTLEKTDRFSNYDSKTNVDDFYLVKDFFDTYLFLPQVKLQKNNALKHQITGVQNDLTQTRGTGAGQSLQITNHFTYY